MSQVSLFLDTSYFVCFGLLAEDFSWLDYQKIQNKKSSALLHGALFDFLEKNEIKIKDLKQIFICNGPGSYTGIRLGEGLCQILKWQGIKINSFYSFEVPSFLGDYSGAWCSEAFKKEVFVYSWKDEIVDTKLIPVDRFLSDEIARGELYHHEGEILGIKTGNTSEMIKNNSELLFTKVASRSLHLDPFYFRTPEQEFNVPKKRDL